MSNKVPFHFDAFPKPPLSILTESLHLQYIKKIFSNCQGVDEQQFILTVKVAKQI